MRPHRHEPDHLNGWVFLQYEVWVDYWGNGHEIELMAGDYAANVIRLCEERVQRIALLVAVEFLYLLGLGLAGLAASPTIVLAEARESAEEAVGVLRDGDAALAWLEELPLLSALRNRLDSTRWAVR